MSNNNSQIKKTGLALMAGMALGYLGSLFISSDTRRQHKQFVEQKATQLKDILTDEDPVKRVKAIFKKNTQEMRDKYQAIKQDLVTKLSQLKGALQDIDKKKYSQVLDRVLDKARRDQELSQAQLERLKQFLSQDFDRIKNSLK
ncbi:MAG: hypothetical protein GF381_00600 [Candidatus Pacebacteria bacterium]|nr:hypothetical protein [Candidatus Paceibacterota bacterium]